MTELTPGSALAGGLLIGASTLLLPVLLASAESVPACFSATSGKSRGALRSCSAWSWRLCSTAPCSAVCFGHLRLPNERDHRRVGFRRLGTRLDRAAQAVME